MFIELENFNTGWVGLKIALKTKDIDTLINNLILLKKEPSQHFHLSSSDFEGENGVSDIEIYINDDSQENMQLTSFVIDPNR